MNKFVVSAVFTEELRERYKKLSKREKLFWEFIAWGASMKEVAAFFKVSFHTVDNTVRHIKEKLGLSKASELSACWFCINFGISFELSPMQRKNIAICLFCIFFSGEALHFSNATFTARRRMETRTGYRIRHENNYWELLTEY